MRKKGSATSIDEHVGSRLRQRRSVMGWSQEKLAESVNITFQQVQKYERGLNRISAGRLFEFSGVLNVPVGYFFEEMDTLSAQGGSQGFAESGQAPYQPENIFERKETIDLIRAYYAIEDEKVRKDLLKLIKSMSTSSSPK